ncbi:hypothetical protein ABPG72_005380 [Tetrahymena utriculariae]
MVGQDLNILENIYGFYNASSIRCNAATNGNVYLEDLQLNTQLLIQLSENNSFQQQIDVEFMKQLIKEISQKKEQLLNKINKEKYSLEYASLNEIAENPLEKLIFSGKHVEINEQYIQIMQEKGKLNKGDIRISFYEIQKIAATTALAVQGKNSLTQHELEGFNQKIEYFINDNKRSQFTSLFSFITKGLIDKKQLVEILQSGVQFASQSQYKKILIHSIIITTLYLYLQQIIVGDEYNYTIYRKQISQNIFEMQNNSDQIQQYKIKIYKDMLKFAFFQSSCHIACLKAISCGRLFITSSLLILALMSYSYEQFGLYLVSVDRIKDDLEEIKQKGQDNSNSIHQEMKDYFSDIISKLN